MYASSIPWPSSKSGSLVLASASLLPPLLSPFLSHVASDLSPSLSSSSAPNVYELPAFRSLPESPAFFWGLVDGESFCKLIEDAYSSVVHWRKNLFRIPLGGLGKEFMLELSRLFYEYASDSMLEDVALKAATTMPSLLLQCPHPHSKVK